MAKYHRKDFEVVIDGESVNFSCESWYDFYCKCVDLKISHFLDYGCFENFEFELQRASTKKIYKLNSNISICMKNCY